MPLTGTLDVAPLVDQAPLIADLNTGPEEFKGLLQAIAIL